MIQTTRPVATAASAQRDSRSNGKVEDIAVVGEMLVLEEVNGAETRRRGTNMYENVLDLDKAEYEENDDALLAKTEDDEDEFNEASDVDSKPTTPSLDLDDDDEDLFREIDAFLWNNYGKEKRLDKIPIQRLRFHVPSNEVNFGISIRFLNEVMLNTKLLRFCLGNFFLSSPLLSVLGLNIRLEFI